MIGMNGKSFSVQQKMYQEPIAMFLKYKLRNQRHKDWLLGFQVAAKRSYSTVFLEL